MINIKKIHKKNFESVPIDPFWNTGAEKELKTHLIHAYPARFPSFITTKALEYADRYHHVKSIDLSFFASQLICRKNAQKTQSREVFLPSVF